MLRITVGLALALIIVALPVYAATRCEDLAGQKLADTTITSARIVAAGAFDPPSQPDAGPGADAAAYKDLPAFCRVMATIKPSKDSDIKMEVWMPVTGWTGRYEGVGNGGFAGSIIYLGLAGALRQGSAVAGTDTGHSASVVDATWALGHPEKITDFGYRAIHEMAVKSKALIQAFYGAPPKHSYFAGCSNGGRQALMEAQRFPEDYDGIIAGAPAYAWTHLLAGAISDAQATGLDANSYIPASRIPAISAGVLAACDAKDGVKDGLVSDPAHCNFDPASIVCKPEQGTAALSCITAPQAVALKKLYAGARLQNGEQVRPGFLPGGEEGPGGWGAWITGMGPGRSLLFLFTNGFFKDMVFNDPNWDIMKASLDASVKAADEKQAQSLNATDPDLKAFKARGGKLILYHGWSDPAITALGTIDYYNKIADVAQFSRLYLAAGMQHCAGGPGPDSFGQFERSATPNDPQKNVYAAIEQWVEKGIAPDKLIAVKKEKDAVKMSRPLCAYPQTAKYKGMGDVNEAANWECK
ncbi:MAG: tannase/feruloyl esterase family alpha/beta hydrolase [Candidatus Angelobacter sp. Gp1-AA117]|nr:MAG: tannase/feruloyl esterase family alpha/beta hydrolase [Candidatus Angelobacter sp. Gp1-AA117]